MNTKLIELRKAKNISQGKFAQILGITQQAYCNYEKGIRQIPDDLKIKIADFFNVSIDYLIGRSDFKNPESTDLAQDNKNVITIYGRGSGIKTAELTDKQYQAVLAVIDSFAENPDDPFKK